MPLPHPELAAAWRSSRPAAEVAHIDSAARSRASHAVLEAVARHAAAESRTGGYVAEAVATPILEQGRADLAALLGTQPRAVHYAGSATAALGQLLDSWQVPANAVAAVLPGEYGATLEALARHGIRTVQLPTDTTGRADATALAEFFDRHRPDFVHLTLVSSHRGVRQPGGEIADACRTRDVPLVIDVAQAIGQADCRLHAHASYGTSRKWLAGPRGVGFLAVNAHAAAAPWMRPAADAAASCELAESHVAGRVGLAVAVAEHLTVGPDRIRERLAALGALSRALLSRVAGWRVVEPDAAPVAITTVEPEAGLDPRAARELLLRDHGVLCSACPTSRAPHELTRPVLRFSPHVDTEEEDLQRVAAALTTVTGAMAPTG